MTNGRRKGSTAELEVAKLLQGWWQIHEPTAKFVRVPLSGGWSTAQVRGEFRASGDLMTTAATFPFTIEVKRREAFAWQNVFEGRRSPVWKWWEQAVAQGVESGLTPLLWARRKAEDWRVIAEPEVGRLLQDWHIPARQVKTVRTPGRWSLVVFPAACLLSVPPGRVAEAIPILCGRAKVRPEVTPDGTPNESADPRPDPPDPR